MSPENFNDSHFSKTLLSALGLVTPDITGDAAVGPTGVGTRVHWRARAVSCVKRIVLGLD